MMKKLLMLALALCLCTTVCASALAAELNKDVLQGSTQISMEIDHDQNSFVVVIPASATIDPETKTGNFDITLKSGWKLISSNGLRVRIKEFANGVKSTGSSYFTLQNNNGTKASYDLLWKAENHSSYWKLTQTESTNTYKWDTADLIHVTKSSSNAKDWTANLKMTVPTLPTEPGVYTDTITFAITLY